MARIPQQPRILKDGTAVYDVQVYINDSAKKLYHKTYRREPGISENENKRRLQAFAVEFESELRNNLRLEKQESENRRQNLTFADFSNKWLFLSEQNNSKTTIARKIPIVADLNRFLGKMPLIKIQSYDIEPIVSYLNSKKITRVIAVLKKDIDEILSHNNIDALCRQYNFSTATVFAARHRQPIMWSYAVELCQALNINVHEYFTKDTQERPFAKGSKLVYRKILNAIFNYAIELDLIDKNPCRNVMKPKYLSGEIKEKEILTLEEFEQLKATLKSLTMENDLKRKTAITMLYSLGLRQGELAGLQWGDIDLDSDQPKITIQRSSTYTGKRFGLVTKTPKTEKSIRTLPIPQKLLEVLREYKTWYNQEYERLQPLWDEQKWLLTTQSGKQIQPRTIGFWLDQTLTQGHIRHVSCHSLRHTFITLLLRSGMPVNQVAKLAGHANPNVTLSTYAHFLDEDNLTAVSAMNNLLN